MKNEPGYNRSNEFIPDLVERHLERDDQERGEEEVLGTRTFILILAIAGVLCLVYALTLGPMSH